MSLELDLALDDHPYLGIVADLLSPLLGALLTFGLSILVYTWIVPGQDFWSVLQSVWAWVIFVVGWGILVLFLQLTTSLQYIHAGLNRAYHSSYGNLGVPFGFVAGLLAPILFVLAIYFLGFLFRPV